MAPLSSRRMGLRDPGPLVEATSGATRPERGVLRCSLQKALEKWVRQSNVYITGTVRTFMS